MAPFEFFLHNFRPPDNSGKFISNLQPILEAGVQVLDVLVNEAGELEMLLSPLGRLLALGLIIMYIINF